MFDRFQSRILIAGRVKLETPLRIGTGRSTDPVATDLPVIRDAMGRPYIPGSSLKGVLRARVEALIRGILGDARQYACDPTDEKKWCIEGKEENERNFGERVLAKSCLVCQVFGSPWLASHVLIRDLPVDEKLWVGQFAVRDGVAIDRDTETAADKKKYDFEVVPGGSQFLLKIVAENLDPLWKRGALLAGLAQFDEGHLSLGGGRSRGLGQVSLEWEAQLWEGKTGLLDQLEGKPGETVTSEIKGEWRKAFAKELRAKLEGNHA